jgi:hypothetical protein
MISFSQCETEVIKVFLVANSADTQHNIKYKDQSDPFKYILLKPEDKVGKTDQHLEKIKSVL